MFPLEPLCLRPSGEAEGPSRPRRSFTRWILWILYYDILAVGQSASPPPKHTKHTTHAGRKGRRVEPPSKTLAHPSNDYTNEFSLNEFSYKMNFPYVNPLQRRLNPNTSWIEDVFYCWRAEGSHWRSASLTSNCQEISKISKFSVWN